MSRPEIVSDTFEEIVAWLDEALGMDWSFRVVSHQVRESEALVLGELTHGTVARQQFGSARVTSDGHPEPGELLKAAATDALQGCRSHFRRMRSPARRSQPNGEQRTVNGNKKTPLTNQQLAAIFSLARFRGLDQAAVATLTREKFTRDPEELDRQQAAQVISDLVIRHQKKE